MHVAKNRTNRWVNKIHCSLIDMYVMRKHANTHARASFAFQHTQTHLYPFTCRMIPVDNVFFKTAYGIIKRWDCMRLDGKLSGRHRTVWQCYENYMVASNASRLLTILCRCAIMTAEKIDSCLLCMYLRKRFTDRSWIFDVYKWADSLSWTFTKKQKQRTEIE